MKWKLKEIRQETDHPFLNYYTLIYDVIENNKHHDYSYYLVSRRKKEELLAYTHQYSTVDGIVIPLYYKDPKTNEVSLMMTRQFRPAVGTYVTSFPAGLKDKDDKDIQETIRREAKEEAGVEIADIEILSQPGPTSSGMSDEFNMVALARIVSFGKTHLEDFEDIGVELVPLQEVRRRLKDNEHYLFPVNIRILCLYLLERFDR